MTTLNVITCHWGDTYFKNYVSPLENMVARNLTEPYTFKCFSGDELMELAPPQFWQYPSPGRPGLFQGYPLLFCFNPKLPIRGRVLFLGLDLVITGSLDELVKQQDEFIGIRDWVFGTINSSVMYFEAGSQGHVFNDFPLTYEPELLGKYDMDWIAAKIPDAKTWPDEWVKSYKFHCQDGIVPKGCKIVVFHGHPKNHEAKDKWVGKLWI